MDSCRKQVHIKNTRVAMGTRVTSSWVAGFRTSMNCVALDCTNWPLINNGITLGTWSCSGGKYMSRTLFTACERFELRKKGSEPLHMARRSMGSVSRVTNDVKWYVSVVVRLTFLSKLSPKSTKSHVSRTEGGWKHETLCLTSLTCRELALGGYYFLSPSIVFAQHPFS